MYKQLGCRWVAISKYLTRHTEGDIKNKFYTTLKRVATQAQLEDPIRFNSDFEKCKSNLVQFVDAAMQYGHLLSSKKGRKKNSDKVKARTVGLLFPKSISPTRPTELIPVLPQMPSLANPYTGHAVVQYPGIQWYSIAVYQPNYTPYGLVGYPMA